MKGDMLMIGITVYFKTEGMQRTRKGTVIAGNNVDGWQVKCCRTATSFKAEVLTIAAEHLTTEDDHKAKLQRSPIHENGRITATEMNRRAEIAAERLQLSEAQVLRARAMLEIRRSTLRKLAYKNAIAATGSDFDFQELVSEYLVASIEAYRTAAHKASSEDLRAFHDQLEGRTSQSNIMLTIARTAKTTAIRWLKARQEYRQRHYNISDYEWRLAA